MSIKLLEGQVTDTGDDYRVADLEHEIQDLRHELEDARRQMLSAKRESARALGKLRRQLSPLYEALKDVFGELDAAGVEHSDDRAVDSRTARIWEQWKDKLGPTCGKAIEALLLNQEMTQQQLAISLGVSRQHASNIVSKLNTTGLVNKNGGRISLKAL